jgi:hypothetical protein
MKKKFTSILLFIFIGITVNAFSQEWKWREEEEWKLPKRVLEITEYNSSVFNDKADFRKAQFELTANFDDATFALTADFSGSQFASTAYFNYAKFKSTAVFVETKFASIADFMDAHFDSIAYFNYAKFASTASFSYVKFDSSAYFVETKFDSSAYFYSAKFASTAVFEKAQFASIADFSDVKFDSIAKFSEAEFTDRTIFEGAALPKYLDLSRVTKIATEMDFTASVIVTNNKICYINLTGSAIDKIRFRYNRFKLWFPEEDSAGYELKANVYQQLLEKQKAEGFTQSYEKLDKEYREFQYTDPGAGKGAWGIFLNWVDKNWWEYGYNKELIIRNALLIFLILSFINSFFLKYLITQVYSNEKISKLIEKRETKNGLIRWFDSLRYSIFYTAVIFFSFNFDMDKLNYAGNLDGWKVFNLTWFMIIYLGGVVCMAYLANYIITV